MMMTTFSRVLAYPFTESEETSTNNALIQSEDQDKLRKGSSKILRALLFPYNTSTSTLKQVKNIIRMGSNSTNEEQIQHQIPKIHEKSVKPHKEVLQTKNIQKITRNDLINGTYDLNANPIRRHTTDSNQRRHRHHHHHHRHHKGSNHRSRSKTTSSSTRSPSSSRSQESRNTIQIADIDDDYIEENEMFISAHDQLLKNSKRVSETDVSRYTNMDGTLTVPVQRSWTLDESDVSDYHPNS